MFAKAVAGLNVSKGVDTLMKPLSPCIFSIILSIIVCGTIAIASYSEMGVLSLAVFIILIGIVILVAPLKKAEETVVFTKLRHGAKIPNKRREDAGYDIYPCFSDEFITIAPHETKMIPTGLGSKIDKKYYFQLFERGSTGTKGIAQRCGVIDSGFRGEWFVPITNTTEKELVISKNAMEFEENSDAMVYPYGKAICQAMLLPVPNVHVKEVTKSKFKSFASERSTGKLGSSGK